MINRVSGATARFATNRWTLDISLAVAVAALNVTTSMTPAPEETYYSYREPHLVLLVTVMGASGLALIWRRQTPVTVAVVVLSIFTLVTFAEWQPGSIAISVMVVFFTLGTHASLRTSAACAGGLVASCVAMIALEKPFFDNWLSLVTVPVFLAPWLAGRIVLRYREAGERERQRVIALERRQAIEAERAVNEERLRIAREFHDVISHTLTVINVQSGVANHLLGETRNGAKDALGVIEDASRTALDDLRRMLGVLRNGAETVTFAPSPGIEDLDLLVSAHRATHGPVEITVDHELSAAPASLRLTVFRVVQEALTNIGRHARGSSASITIQSISDAVIVTIIDDGRGSSFTPGASGGFGLTGMRERVALFGGSLETGETRDGGFQVRASLPLRVEQ